MLYRQTKVRKNSVAAMAVFRVKLCSHGYRRTVSLSLTLLVVIIHYGGLYFNIFINLQKDMDNTLFQKRGIMLVVYLKT